MKAVDLLAGPGKNKTSVNKVRTTLRHTASFFPRVVCVEGGQWNGISIAYDDKSKETYLGRVTWVLPIGTISIDFPQNLFLHLTSTKKKYIS